MDPLSKNHHPPENKRAASKEESHSSHLPSQHFKKTVGEIDEFEIVAKLKERHVTIKDKTPVYEIAKEIFSEAQHDHEKSQRVLVLLRHEILYVKNHYDEIDSTIIQLDNYENITGARDLFKLAEKSPLTIFRFALPELPADFQLKNGVFNRIKNYFTEEITPIERHELGSQIIKDINSDNCQEFLDAIKYLDYQFISQSKQKMLQVSSYELRMICAQKSKGKISTAEAFTYSLDPTLYSNRKRLREYLSNEKNFVPERQREHYVILLTVTLDMMNMSRRYNDNVSTIYAVRGNTASGKTYACKKNKMFERGLIFGEAKGSLNPDTVKTALRSGVFGLTDEQMHMEGAALSKKLTEELKSKAVRSSLVIDERLGELEKVKQLCNISEQRSGVLKLIDIEAPLDLTCIRVLRRDIRSGPCVPFKAAMDGFLSVRNNRSQVLREVEKNESIVDYTLRCVDETGESVVVAIKEGKKIKILDKGLYEKSVVEVTNEEAEKLGDQKIDDAFIAEMKKRFPREKLAHLEQFKNLTLSEALNYKSLEVPEEFI